MSTEKIKLNVRVHLVTVKISKYGQRLKNQIVMPDNTYAVVGVDVSERPDVGDMQVDLRYYGIGAPGENTEAFVLSLTREYMADEGDSFLVNAPVGQKVYYAQPKRLGMVQFEYTGVVGGFLSPSTVSVTDPDTQVTEDYYLWESTVDGLLEVEVYVNQS